MAIAVGEIQLTVTDRVPIGGGLAVYFGTAKGGTEYPTGGATLGEEKENSRFLMPSKFKYLQLATLGLLGKFVPGSNLMQLFAEQTVGTSTETPLAELKSKATMATAVAGIPFYAIGFQ